MPDWTYHPLFKPLLFRLPPEEARALTLRLLEIQAATAAGRRLFRLFAPRPPGEEHAVTAFGLRMKSPVGLGPGIDTEAVALTLLQHLGFGFLQVGPASPYAPPAASRAIRCASWTRGRSSRRCRRGRRAPRISPDASRGPPTCRRLSGSR